MATLNSLNIITGNIVESNDILQLYDAFTAGGGTTGAYNVFISGSLTGLATSASFAISASYVETAQTASYAQTSSFVETAQTASYFSGTVVSASYTQTASYVQNAQTASYVQNAQTASYVQNAQTASFIETAQTASYFSGTVVSASYALTASYALNAGTTQWYSPTTNDYSTPSGRDVGILFQYVGTNPLIHLHTSSAQPGDQVMIIVSSSQNNNVTVNVESPAKIALGNADGTSITNGDTDSYWKYICVDETPTWRLVGYSDNDTITTGAWTTTLYP